MTRKKIFYGWYIVLASCIIAAVGIGFYTSTNSMFIKPVCDALGISRSEFSLLRTLILLISALTTPLYGRLIKRYRIKKVILVTAIIYSFAMVAYSFCTELWHLYLIATVIGTMLNGTNFMVLGTLISNWFEDKKGFATGLAFSGSGLGAAIIIPIVSRVIEQTSWRLGYQMLGVVGLVILLPIILILVKDRPEDMGLSPYTSKNPDNSTKVDLGENKLAGIPYREAIKTPTFWLLVSGLFFTAICASGPNTHTAPYLSDMGYSSSYVSAIVSFFMLSMTIGKILLGYLFDRLGTLFGGLFVGICCIAFSVFALIAYIPAIPWVFALLLGFASAGFSVPVSIFVSKYFGQKDFSKIFSLCTMIAMFGSMISVPMMGTIYDNMESYRLAWIVLLISGCIVTICFLGVNISGRKLYKRNSATK